VQEIIKILSLFFSRLKEFHKNMATTRRELQSQKYQTELFDLPDMKFRSLAIFNNSVDPNYNSFELACAEFLLRISREFFMMLYRADGTL
jgi:hypothetical protein